MIATTATTVDGMLAQRVLIVEDDEDYAVFVRRLLTRLGYAEGLIEVAHDEASARRRLDEAPFDVVISDLDLRPGNGLRVLEHVRNRHPAARRILLTSAPEKARQPWATGPEPADAVWDKGSDPGTIRSQLRGLLQPAP